eukprot:TRINITY_DN85090_c0_g1_i1.p1 TRINITY_DN85090_c0_g1~~TRINITY_DN85090_c0_g1_i1.p1  ORF type:complete len:279 (+),score=33.57 TRINITY_DN85090_c0_g1_i1:36-872(+)
MGFVYTPTDVVLRKVYSESLLEEELKELWLTRKDVTADLQQISEKTYGEITTSGVRCLHSAVNLTESDVFADLGSGLGRCVVQTFLETDVRRMLGIELDVERHRAAVHAVETGFSRLLSRVKIRSKTGVHWKDLRGRSLELWSGDCLKMWHVWRKSTVIFCSSLCFPRLVMERLADQIDECHSLRYFISLQMLPRYSTFTLARVERWPMSWQRLGDGCPVYVYERLQSYPLGKSLLEEPWASSRACEDQYFCELEVYTRMLTSRVAARMLLFSLLPLS